MAKHRDPPPPSRPVFHQALVLALANNDLWLTEYATKKLANEQQFRHVFFVHQIKNCCNHDSNSTVTPGLANSNRYLSLFFALSFASSQNKLIETKIVWTKIMNLGAVPVTPYRSCLRLPFLLNPLGDQRSLNRRIPKANGSLLPCLFRDHVGEPNHGDTC